MVAVALALVLVLGVGGGVWAITGPQDITTSGTIYVSGTADSYSLDVTAADFPTTSIVTNSTGNLIVSTTIFTLENTGSATIASINLTEKNPVSYVDTITMFNVTPVAGDGFDNGGLVTGESITFQIQLAIDAPSSEQTLNLGTDLTIVFTPVAP